MQNLIELKDLKREFVITKGWIKRKKEIVKAVDGISFKVKKGEIFGLLGQNGAGKTTIIKMLITLLAPSSGTCKVLGYNAYGEEKEFRDKINFIFGGEMGVYKRLSARDNLKYFANLYYMDEAKANKQIDKLLELVDLKNKADVLVETFSKGMVQRLQIARGLINDPEIIFMDEPTIGLDPLGAKILRNIIRKLKTDGKTIMLTTHYLYEADELCDRIAIINNGHLVALGTPQELRNIISGMNTIEIVLEKVTNETIDVIEKLESVRSVEKADTDKDIKLIIKYLEDADISGNILNSLSGLKILSFNQKELTLEDVYIKLVEASR
ncbi:ABC transporter ATP-binding protein [Sedimentibacter sp.]|uniref:ABC transporter ATP-binding protein n=1 Tax=Sedimentibacter sp. TaxID=1960295 RepID=UPI0028AE3F7C|nr:ABC transporter ATP-binding protein [Sedimentibacter sp.]